ncbi:AraC family transcriptional regulator [Clostridium grantii]|nr:AraC family transcriptional regulator [Clostridium grantii]
MNEYLEFKLNHLTDLDIYQCGFEECNKNHSYGPAMRDHYLIHYIVKGKGNFERKGETYNLSEGQGFLICPNEITYYKADSEEPWTYYWVGFNGVKAKEYLLKANLAEEKPIFDYVNSGELQECLNNMIGTKSMSAGGDIQRVGYLYVFLSYLMEMVDASKKRIRNKTKEEYVAKAIEYIEKNYSRNISISKLAYYIGLDRSYLTFVFKDVLNISPKRFLIEYRINKASELIKNTEFSIGDISRSVGYDDQLAFSKVFKKIKGVAPSEYRKTREIIFLNLRKEI